MNKVIQFIVATAAALALLGGAAQAQTTLAEWNFNANPGSLNPSSGTVQNIAGATPATLSGAFVPIAGGFGPAEGVNVGSPRDTNTVLVGSTQNNSVAGRSGPFSGEVDGPAGIRNLTVTATTQFYDDITVTFDALQGFRASRFHQIFATTDARTIDAMGNPLTPVFVPVTGGIGSSATVLGSSTLAPNGNPQTVQSASVDSNGLLTIITDNNVIPDPATGDAFIQELSFTFPNGVGFDNNPNFGFIIGAVQDPTAGDYVSSFAGTTEAADAVAGYVRSTTDGGNVTLYDLVNISGTLVPEPAGFLPLALAGLAFAGLARRRRSRRS